MTPNHPDSPSAPPRGVPPPIADRSEDETILRCRCGCHEFLVRLDGFIECAECALIAETVHTVDIGSGYEDDPNFHIVSLSKH